MKLADTINLIAVLKAFYPSWQPSKETPQAWQSVLVDFNYDDAERAAKYFAANDDGQFPPSVGQLIQAIRELTNELAGEGAHFEQLLSVIRSEGYMSRTAMDKLSPENQKIVRRLGGWGQYGVNAMSTNDLQREYHFKFSDAEREVKIERERERLAALPQGETDGDYKELA